MKKCSKCNKKILPNQRAVMLKDFESNKTIDSTYWHKECYNQWLNEKLEEKAMKIYDATINKAFPQLQQVVGEIINNAKANSSQIF